MEALQTNTQRLQEYCNKLILFLRKANKPKAGDSDVRVIIVVEFSDNIAGNVHESFFHYLSKQIVSIATLNVKCAARFGTLSVYLRINMTT